MSGGHWRYREQRLDLLVEQLPWIIQFAQDCLTMVDYAISGDTDQERVEKELFRLTERFGDRLYGNYK